MELHSADIKRIKDIVEDWSKNPVVELEATFGKKGVVDMQTFLRVITRLKSKGYEPLPQEEKLTISLTDSTRFTLTGEGLVKHYCYDDTIAGKEFIAIIKDRNISKEDLNKSNIDLEEYDVRIKARREVPFSKDDKKIQDLLASWKTQKKYFRLIRRWSFKGKGVKFDLSMVRSTPQGKTTVSFQEANILKQRPIYEIEVEIDRDEFKEINIDEVYTKLVQGIGEILRGIQGCPILIRKSIKTNVLEDYNKLTKLDVFRGVAPVTLGVRHMVENKDDGTPNIRTGYNVTDKADGLRVHGFTDNKGELFMIDNSLNVYKTGLTKLACKNALLDGEYVTQDKEKKGIQDLLFFDIYYMEGNDVSQKPFQGEGGRYNDMLAWMKAWNNDGGPNKQMKTVQIQVYLKNFYFAKPGKEIFALSSQLLSSKQFKYHTDGLIFTPNTLPLPKRTGGFSEQFKWKPASENTVDFLSIFDKDAELGKDVIVNGLDPNTNEPVRYKIVRLLVNSRDQQSPRDVILNMLPYEENKGDSRPVLFNPPEYPDLMANVCYLKTELDLQTNEEYVKTEQDEPIRDKNIVEMRYDGKRAPGWRWIPMRIRIDKTERFAKGGVQALTKTMNSSGTANDIWVSIHNPVTEHMIRTGDEQPSDKEKIIAEEDTTMGIQKKYREKPIDRENKSKVQDMLDFHNRYIKIQLLYGAIFSNEKTKKILDMTVGEASDLYKWVEGKAQFVLGVDLAGNSILNSEKGAYSRLLREMVKRNRYKTQQPLPNIFFVIGDSSKKIIDGSAGIDQENQDMLRSIFGENTVGPVPKLVGERGTGELKGGVDAVVCMYALHYFFESETTLNGYIQNIADTLKVGGYFVGTNFDGQAVFDLLRNKKQGDTYEGRDGDTVIYEITKHYSGDELPIDSSEYFTEGKGMAIDVKFITIGTTQREYLIPWQMLVNKLKTIGCELVGKEELASMGIASSTNMYTTSYDMMMKSKDKKYSIISPVAKEFSFLNRWYIFKRVGNNVNAPVAEVVSAPDVPDVPASVGVPDVTELAKLSAAVEKPESLQGGPAFVQSIAKKKYTPNEIYQFNEKSPEKDKTQLDIAENYKKYAGRWMSPNAPFQIVDSSDGSKYPSITHYLEGMKLKYSSSKPDLASQFGVDGAIHIKFLPKMIGKTIGKTITLDKYWEEINNETKEIELETKKILKRVNIGFNQAIWNSKFDELLKDAIKQRLQKDKWFCVIVEAVVRSEKYLLYQDSKTSVLGGVRGVDGFIQGENKYGKYILELATSSPDTLKACVVEGREPPV